MNTQLQSKPLVGHRIKMAFWQQEVAQQTGTLGFGTRIPCNLYTQWTLALKSATLCSQRRRTRLSVHMATRLIR